MKTRFCAFLMLAVCPLLAQQPPEKTVTKLVPMKYFGDRAAALLEGIGLIIKNTGGMIVITGPEDRVNAAELILKQIDTPPPPPKPQPRTKEIELTIYMVAASTEQVEGKPLPADLEPVVRQMRNAFAYKSFAVMDTAFLRLSDGRGGTTGGIMANGNYSIGVGQIIINPGGNEGRIRLDLDVSLTIQKQGGARIKTEVDVGEGQKVVVGKAGIGAGTGGNAVFVVLAAKVVD